MSNLSGTGNTLGAGDQMAAAVVTPAGTVFTYTYDADGNVTTRTNTNTGVTYSYTWSAENLLMKGGLTTTGDTVNRLSWKGLSYDSDLGLTYVRGRWYDPK